MPFSRTYVTPEGLEGPLPPLDQTFGDSLLLVVRSMPPEVQGRIIEAAPDTFGDQLALKPYCEVSLLQEIDVRTHPEFKPQLLRTIYKRIEARADMLAQKRTVLLRGIGMIPVQDNARSILVLDLGHYSAKAIRSERQQVINCFSEDETVDIPLSGRLPSIALGHVTCPSTLEQRQKFLRGFRDIFPCEVELPNALLLAKHLRPTA